MKLRHAAALALVGWYLMSPAGSRGADEPQQTPSAEQVSADSVANHYALDFLKIPGVFGVAARMGQDGRMYIAVLIDAITPEIQTAVPPTLEGFPVVLSVEERQFMLGQPQTKLGHPAPN